MGNCVSLRGPLPVSGEETFANGTSDAARLPPKQDAIDLQQIAGYSNLQTFTYGELRLATDNFRPDKILGQGGFGLVYKGAIDDNVRPGLDHTPVAVKELNPRGFQGHKEWLAEVNYLGQFSHPNLVKLIGYCCEEDHRLLVYEYMDYGSLEKHLFRRSGATLPWLTRMKIALDTAKGLAFLHGAERPIIYRDFKASNILIDAEYNGKLSDFGLAKEGPMGEQTHVSTRVMGTFGYTAPEYILTGHLTSKSDVYGFGVVLLEMLIGRRVMDHSKRSRQHDLVKWACPLLVRSSKLLKIIDPRLEGQYSNKDVERVARLAYDCLNQNPKMRPVMSEVVDILQAMLRKDETILPHSPEAAMAPPEVGSAVVEQREAVGHRKSEVGKEDVDGSAVEEEKGEAVGHGKSEVGKEDVGGFGMEEQQREAVGKETVDGAAVEEQGAALGQFKGDDDGHRPS
ncbi:hypothetical protein OPV22_018559 [Ensete ventricosum]|uniref:non-specific serine/threonine protein kinase n=1 Tax=Ensete ventricosum TaxID=4639 RepID=A0AAV8R4K4_ENSVE|nr:hypothetical protein OPV22_018559 [Ensete ventricosum]